LSNVVDGMVQYVQNNMPLISTELMSLSEVEAFVEHAEYSAVGEE